MNKKEFKRIIREEIKKQLNEKSFGMFSDRGNQKIERLFYDILELYEEGYRVSKLLDRASEGFDKIAKVHGEAWDTEVRSQFISKLKPELKKRGASEGELSDLTVHF